VSRAYQEDGVQLVECVPNFSEGRDREVIDAITTAIGAVPNVEVLDVDPGAATNRTVVTFIGPAEAVEEAAFRGVARAADLIDMRNHHGAHPRMGATDVCPFVPVQEVTIDDCAAIARRVGRRIGDELGIPVWLYEYAAATGRRSLSDVRRGEYEGLAERADAPDFGPGGFNPRSGATAVGARQFLIAYNVNLNTTDRRPAHQIAQAIRELGTPRRDASGSIVKDSAGRTIFDPGRFKECKAVGWYIDEYDRAQVSINLTDFTVTSLHDVFDACREEAAGRGLRVTGSELVGLVPRAAMLAAGDYYLRAQGQSTGVPEAARIHAAVMSLGLAELAPFVAGEKIVEYRYSGGTAPLRAMTLAGFADEVSTSAPTPGGGSVAALNGSLAAGLVAMVAALTHGKKGLEELRPQLEQLGVAAQELKEWYLGAVDRDTAAFNAVMAAMRLPRKTAEEVVARDAAIAAANLGAATVPLEVLERVPLLLALTPRHVPRRRLREPHSM
jgi:glutamate formiminotransferase/formiminotetrahydrofolate cyclodeaminase